jgi:hypothetical protein
VMSTIMAST